MDMLFVYKEKIVHKNEEKITSITSKHMQQTHAQNCPLAAQRGKPPYAFPFPPFPAAAAAAPNPPKSMSIG